MHKIPTQPILVFLMLFGSIISLGIISDWWLVGSLSLGDFRGFALIASGVVFIYLWAFIVYRTFLHLFPLEAGELDTGSRGEFVAEVNMLFYLLIFNPLILTHFLPAPLSRLVYIALGLRIGRDSYSVGVILDPPMTKIGKNSIIGHDALLLSHVIEGKLLALLPITIGNNVTIGTKAIIMPGVTIEDQAVVSVGAIVTKGTHIGPGEIWGGIPAKFLKHIDDV